MKTKKLLTWVAAATMLVGLASCNEPAPAPEPEPEPVVTLSSIEITEEPDKLSYFVGEDFESDGLEVVAHYSDKSTKDLDDSKYTLDLEDGYKFTEADAGNKRVTVTYQDMTDFFTVKVLKAQLVGIRIDADDVQDIYRLGDELDTEDLTVYAVYNNGKEAELSPEEYVLHTPDMYSYGEKNVYIDYKGYRDYYTIEVVEDPWYEIVEDVLASVGLTMYLPGTTDQSDLYYLDPAAMTDGVDEDGNPYLAIEFDNIFADYGFSNDYFAVTTFFEYYEPLGEAEATGDYSGLDFALYGMQMNYTAYIQGGQDYGYAEYLVMSGISEDGMYVLLDFRGIADDSPLSQQYDDMQPCLTLTLTFMQAYDAEKVEYMAAAACYGEDSIVGLPAQKADYVFEGLDEVSDYYLVEYELDVSDEIDEFAQEMTLALANDYLAKPALQIAKGWDSSEECYYIDAYMPTEYFTVESCVDILVAVLGADFGFNQVIYTNYDPDFFDVNDPLKEVAVANEDGSLIVDVYAFNLNEERNYLSISIYYGETAYTKLTDLSIILPLAGQTEANAILDTVNPDAFELIKDPLWLENLKIDSDAFAQSIATNDSGYVARATVEAYWVNFVLISFEKGEKIFKTSDAINETNTILNRWFGFETAALPDLTSAMAHVMFGYQEGESASEQYRMFMFTGLDPEAPTSGYPTEPTALENAILALFEANDAWEIDTTQYDEYGYIATSKEAIYLAPGDENKSYVRVNWFAGSGKLNLYVTVIEKPASEPVLLPVELINAAVDAFYGVEGTSQILGLAALAETAFGAEKYDVNRDYEEGEHDIWTISSEAFSDPASLALTDYAVALFTSEDWTCNKDVQPPKWRTNGEYKFTHKETGLIVRITYSYDSSLVENFTMVIEMNNNPEPEPVPLSPSETIAALMLEGKTADMGLDFTAFDAFNVTLDTVITYASGTNRGQANVLIELKESAVEEQGLAFYNAALALYNEILDDLNNNPNSRWSESMDYSYNPQDPSTGYMYAQYLYYNEEDKLEGAIYFNVDMDYGDYIVQWIMLGDFVEPVPQGEGSLGAIVEEFVAPYFDEYYLTNTVSFSACTCTFAFEETGKTEASYTMKTEAETLYQLALVLEQLVGDFQRAGFKLVGQDPVTGAYTLVAENDLGRCTVTLSIGMNAETGAYEVTVKFAFEHLAL